MTDAAETLDRTEHPLAPRVASPSRSHAPIVPKSSIAGRALVAVIAIMTFLAALTTGAVVLVRATASEWQTDVAREVTIQVRPVAGRDIEADVRRASELAREVAGIVQTNIQTREESMRLLEPWLGSGLQLSDLPIPRLIVVRVARGGADVSALRHTLAEQVPGALLDDHRGWVQRMRTMTNTVLMSGIVILLLVLTAMILSVTFATRGAMATNRPIVEVLHFIGARRAFIVRQFQRHFLALGFKGGALGGGAAGALFLVAEGVNRWTGGSEVAALFGTFSLGAWGYALLALEVLAVALVTAVTSRRTVSHTLDSID